MLLTVSGHAKILISPVDYVNPLVGTESKSELSTGNTYPAVALPWGMNFWTAQTGKMGDGWVYTYGADKIRGLKQTHQPSPWINDYGQFSIMPVTGHKVFDEEGRASWFSHKAETATPYYYKVYLADHDATAEIAPTSRAAAVRITYPEKDTAYFVVDAFDKGSSVTILPDQRTVIGYTTKNSGGVPDGFKNYFILRFDHAFTYTGTLEDGMLKDGRLSSTCDHAMAVVGFHTRRGEQVNVQIASSFISDEQALRNLKEVEGRSFDEVKEAGRTEWNRVLGRIEVEDDNIDHLRTFYSCLYRSVLFPGHSTRLTRRAASSTTVRTTARCFPAICLPIQASGTLSGRSSHCLTLSIHRRTRRCRPGLSMLTRRAASCLNGQVRGTETAW